MRKQFSFSVFLLIVFNLSAFGQIDFELLSVKKMQKDLELLLETLHAHPDPYSKISEADFNAHLVSVEQNISKEIDEVEFYKNLSSIIALIGDGHSSVYMPKWWLKNLRKEHGVFPYEVYLTNEDELYVIKSYNDKLIPLGAQITAINGMPVDAFVEAVSKFISYETKAFRNDQISESFEFLLYLLFKQVNDLKLTFKVVEESEVKISTIEYKEWKGLKKDLQEEREKKISLGKPYDFSILKPGIAKIDIFSFGISDFDKYNLFLIKTFKQIEKNEIHSLIIDVRGNYGGWPKVGSGLFHYIHDGYFKTMAKSSMKVSNPYRRHYTDNNPGLRTANIKFPKRRHYLNLEKVIKGRAGTYVDEESFFNEEPVSENHEFTGDCYLLIDRKSYSASSSFASTFQCYSMGYIIGEPTGGTKIFRANPFTRLLPKTGFRVRMSTTKLWTACYNDENEPVIPNVEVVPSILDRVHDVDSQLNIALRAIQKIQKGKTPTSK